MESQHTDIERQIFRLYYDNIPENVQKIDHNIDDDDFRRAYIADDGRKKLVIKLASNTFTDQSRIQGWGRLIDEYNKLGIYCPRILPNKNGDLTWQYTENGRDYIVYAEEYAKYDTAEQAGADGLKDETGRPSFVDDVLRSVGKVAASHFDFLPFHSLYCLLEPFSAPDTTDEGTECAILFRDYVREELPKYSARADKLMELYYANQDALRKIYPSLPVSCFQADINDSNVLLDENRKFVGLIDFNLCGREPVLNYAVRLAQLQVYNDRFDDPEDTDSYRQLYWYDEKLDQLRIKEFLHNLAVIGEFYHFSDAEREAFPVLLRYIDSFWWEHVNEIRKIKDDDAKITMLFDWLEHQMTRDDIRLP